MKNPSIPQEAAPFLKNLGLPNLSFHSPRTHFDFTRSGRRILVIGPMGSGKTEYSAGVWRDAKITLRKSTLLRQQTETAGADRRQVFFVRSQLDNQRFKEYPEDALAYRGGYERCAEGIAQIRDSFDLERVMAAHPQHGTWIIDEASFYDERLVYVSVRESERRGLTFIYPTLVLNFRREIFNTTAALLLEKATDVFPLTAYCEHPDCLADAVYTFRYYSINNNECPALYFDPLIVIGGDRHKESPQNPNYSTRCDHHHRLPGKEYSYFTLKPLGQEASRGNLKPLQDELFQLQNSPKNSALKISLQENHTHNENSDPLCLNALLVPFLAEKALIYLAIEQNLLSRDHMKILHKNLQLDSPYLNKCLKDNHREILLE